MFSSLVTRLTLAVLAVLLLSLGLTAAVFVGQLQVSNMSAARRVVNNDQLALQVKAQVVNALLNARARAGHPLTRVDLGRLGIDRILLTTWPDNAVVDDTERGAAPVGIRNWRQSGTITIGTVDYVYRTVPWQTSTSEPPALTAPSGNPYRAVILLERVTPLPQLALTIAGRLTEAGAIAVLISSLAALLVFRTITRPLHSMTVASERMAAGDYDQHVMGADSRDEVGQLARSFNRMASEVKRVREMQRQFIANVSHDLRSPLTSIIGFSQALTEDATITPAQRRTAEIISIEAERMHRLTMDLLDLSRLEAGHLPLSKRPLDLNTLLHDIALRYHALPNKRGVRFAENLSRDPLPILGDPDRLTQVVVNLLDNALKFCNPGGEVRLSSMRHNAVAVIEVYNSGAGIAREDLPRVFDRFYRGDHSRAQRTGGSGIGLAIVRELVYAHGGAVEATSELGRWTAMCVRLPLATETFTKVLQEANTEATSIAE